MLPKKKTGPITGDTFLRDMPYSNFRKIVEELNLGEMWERVAEKIPVKAASIYGLEPFEPRYTTKHIERFTTKNQHRGNCAAKAMLTDWSTQNVKIKDFLAILHQCCLWRLADYVVQVVLGNKEGAVKNHVNTLLRSLPRSNNELTTAFVRTVLQEASESDSPKMAETLLEENPLTGFVPPFSDAVSEADTLEERLSHISGPNKAEGDKGGAPPLSDISDSACCDVANTTKATLSRYGTKWDPNEPDKSDESTPTFQILLPNVSYQMLEKITNNFNAGNLLGEGGFGSVYLGVFMNGFKIAAKCLKDDSEETKDQFRNEGETLCQFTHTNVVRLFGYSVDGEKRCLIYEYMVNGSLEERLALKYDTPPLSVAMRLEIVRGTARGIVFLNQGGLVHRDIKTANILLDDDFTPKVADFATARVTPGGQTDKLMKTNLVIGTKAYMAPEAENFFVDPKLDSFSFGVVLLEILTGLPVVDHEREETDLKFHVMEHCTPADEDDEDVGTIYDLLDLTAGDWDTDIVDTLYKVANQCLEQINSRRPIVQDVLPELESIVPSLKSSHEL